MSSTDRHIPWSWRACVWALLAVMVLAQASALMHRVLHAHAHGLSHKAGHSALAQHVSVESTGSASQELKTKLADLWSEHGSRSDCQLVDQMVTVAPMLAWTALAVAVLASHEGWGVVAHPLLVFERFYSAQAPPASI